MPKKRRCFHRPTFWFPEEETLVSFVPYPGVPGYTHRVTINGCAVDWLSLDHNPTAANAEYFEEKHRKATLETKHERS